jgi:hypothetical protein
LQYLRDEIASSAIIPPVAIFLHRLAVRQDLRAVGTKSQHAFPTAHVRLLCFGRERRGERRTLTGLVSKVGLTHKANFALND